MIQHALHENQFLQACKYYREVFNTKSVQEDELKWSEIMRYIVMFIVLSTYDHEQRDLISRISKEPKLERLPLYK
jgi:26S proteasome regulatory subunit N5